MHKLWALWKKLRSVSLTNQSLTQLINLQPQTSLQRDPIVTPFMRQSYTQSKSSSSSSILRLSLAALPVQNDWTVQLVSSKTSEKFYRLTSPQLLWYHWLAQTALRPTGDNISCIHHAIVSLETFWCEPYSSPKSYAQFCTWNALPKYCFDTQSRIRLVRLQLNNMTNITGLTLLHKFIHHKRYLVSRTNILCLSSESRDSIWALCAGRSANIMQSLNVMCLRPISFTGDNLRK